MPETTDGLIRSFVLKVGQNTIDLPAGAILEAKPLGRLWWPLLEVTLPEMEAVLGANHESRGIPMIYTRLEGERARFWPMAAAPCEARTRFRNEKTSPDGSFELFQGLLDAIFSTPPRPRTGPMPMVSLKELIEKARAMAAAVPKAAPQPSQADVSVAEPTAERVKTSGDQYQTLLPGALFQIEADLDWLTSEGELPRRMVLTPDHGKTILERLRAPKPPEAPFNPDAPHLRAGAQTGRIPDRMALAMRLAAERGPGDNFYQLAAEETEYLRRLVLQDIYPPQQMYVGTMPLSDEKLKDLLKPGGTLFVPDPPRTDLDDVLDEYRRWGHKAGCQVYGPERVVSWVGDIEAMFTPQPNFRMTPPPYVPLPVLHEARGADAIEAAAKWLREQMPKKGGPIGSGGVGNG